MVEIHFMKASVPNGVSANESDMSYWKYSRDLPKDWAHLVFWPDDFFGDKWGGIGPEKRGEEPRPWRSMILTSYDRVNHSILLQSTWKMLLWNFGPSSYFFLDLTAEWFSFFVNLVVSRVRTERLWKSSLNIWLLDLFYFLGVFLFGLANDGWTIFHIRSLHLSCHKFL